MIFVVILDCFKHIQILGLKDMEEGKIKMTVYENIRKMVM
jgi:hypothetical protein